MFTQKEKLYCVPKRVPVQYIHDLNTDQRCAIIISTTSKPKPALTNLGGNLFYGAVREKFKISPQHQEDALPLGRPHGLARRAGAGLHGGRTHCHTGRWELRRSSSRVNDAVQTDWADATGGGAVWYRTGCRNWAVYSVQTNAASESCCKSNIFQTTCQVGPSRVSFSPQSRDRVSCTSWPGWQCTVDPSAQADVGIIECEPEWTACVQTCIGTCICSPDDYQICFGVCDFSSGLVQKCIGNCESALCRACTKEARAVYTQIDLPERPARDDG